VKLGIFGGSFDPVHVGHLRVAKACIDAAALEELWFVPSATQPHKPDGAQASAEHRVNMLELAICAIPNARISRMEIDRGGTSYTVDTLRALQAQRPGDELFLVLGADALTDLPNWRKPEEISRLATLVVVARPGEQLAPPKAEWGSQWIEAAIQPTDVSSTDIRHRIANGQPIDGFVPGPVAEYIAAHSLYQIL